MLTRLVLACAALATVAGCADLRLYRASDDEAAKKSAAAISDANLKSAIEPERAALRDFSARQLEAVRRNGLALRDAQLVSWLTATESRYSWEGLDAYIKQRITYIVGPNSDAATIRAALDTQREMGSALGLAARTYALANSGGVPKCPAAANQRPFLSYDNACKTYLDAGVALERAFASGGGRLGALSMELKQIKEAQSAASSKLAESRSEYAKALSELKTEPDPSKLQIGLAKLKSKFEDLALKPELASRLNDDEVLKRLLDEGKIEQLKAKRAIVRELIDAAGGEPGTGQMEAQKRARAAGSVIDALANDPAAPLTGLLLQSQFLKTEAQAAEARVARAKQKIQLLDAEKGSLLDELKFLVDDVFKSREASKKECPAKPNIYAAYTSGDRSCKLSIAKALVGYMNAVTFGEIEQDLIGYRQIALAHDVVLDESEAGLAQTDTLLRVPVNQLARVYAGGVKPEEIGNIINAIGLGAIAVRVK